MYLGGFHLGEQGKGLLGQGAGPVLHGPGQPVLLAGDPREGFQHIKVHLHLGQGAVGQHYAAVHGAGLHRDLADARQIADLGQVLVHEGPQVLGGGIAAPDLADLAAQGGDDALGLGFADVTGEEGGEFGVRFLLFLQVFLVQVHHGGGVDVDVVEAGGQGVADQVLEGLDLGLGVFLIGLEAHLEVVALNEHRALVALLDGRGQDAGGVFVGRLVRVADLGTRDFKDEGAGIHLLGHTEHPAGAVVGEAAQVHGGHGEAAVLAAAAAHVKLMDGSKMDAQGLGRGPDQEAGGLLQRRFWRKHRGVHPGIHQGADLFKIQNLDGVVLDFQGTVQVLLQGLQGTVHREPPGLC